VGVGRYYSDTVGVSRRKVRVYEDEDVRKCLREWKGVGEMRPGVRVRV
jgi:hypothetical protein